MTKLFTIKVIKNCNYYNHTFFRQPSCLANHFILLCIDCILVYIQIIRN